MCKREIQYTEYPTDAKQFVVDTTLGECQYERAKINGGGPQLIIHQVINSCGGSTTATIAPHLTCCPAGTRQRCFGSNNGTSTQAKIILPLIQEGQQKRSSDFDIIRFPMDLDFLEPSYISLTKKWFHWQLPVKWRVDLEILNQNLFQSGIRIQNIAFCSQIHCAG